MINNFKGIFMLSRNTTKAIILTSALCVSPYSFAKMSLESCIDLQNQNTHALVADDWTKLESLARRYISSCSQVVDARTLSNAHLNLAFASFGLNQPRNAVSAADACIDIYYGNSGCHISRAEALIKLNKIPEAQQGLDVAKKLLKFNIDQEKLNLTLAENELDRQLATSSIGKYENFQEWGRELQRHINSVQ